MTETIPSVEEAASDISEKVTILQKMTPTLINAGMKILWAVIIFFIARYIYGKYAVFFSDYAVPYGFQRSRSRSDAASCNRAKTSE